MITEIEGMDVVEGGASHGSNGILGDACKDGIGGFAKEGGEGAACSVGEEEEGGECEEGNGRG